MCKRIIIDRKNYYNLNTRQFQKKKKKNLCYKKLFNRYDNSKLKATRLSITTPLR